MSRLFINVAPSNAHARGAHHAVPEQQGFAIFQYGGSPRREVPERERQQKGEPRTPSRLLPLAGPEAPRPTQQLKAQSPAGGREAFPGSADLVRAPGRKVI